MTSEGSHQQNPPRLSTSVAATGRAAPAGLAAFPTSMAVVTGLGCYTLLGGLTSLLGWAVDPPVLSDWDMDGIAIQPNGALAALLSGAALIALAANRPRTTALLGAIVLALGALTILEYLTGASFGIDTPLTFGRTWGRVGVLAV